MKLRSVDLMLGDWVLYEGSPTKIEQLGQEENIFVPERYYDSSRFIEPVILTAEILENNKIENIGGDFFFSEELLRNNKTYDYAISGFKVMFIENIAYFAKYVDTSRDCFEIPICVIKYVHQLQHALRLCGIEKEIVL